MLRHMGCWCCRKVFEIPCLGYTRRMKEQTDPGYCRRSFSSFVILDCFSSHPTKMQAARSSFVSPLEAPPLCSGSFCGRTRKDDWAGRVHCGVCIYFKLLYISMQAQFVNNSIDSAISIGIGQAKMHDARKVKQQIHIRRWLTLTLAEVWNVVCFLLSFWEWIIWLCVTRVHHGDIVGLAWLRQRLDPYGMAIWPSALATSSAKVNTWSWGIGSSWFLVVFYVGKRWKKNTEDVSSSPCWDRRWCLNWIDHVLVEPFWSHQVLAQAVAAYVTPNPDQRILELGNAGMISFGLLAPDGTSFLDGPTVIWLEPETIYSYCAQMYLYDNLWSRWLHHLTWRGTQVWNPCDLYR